MNIDFIKFNDNQQTERHLNMLYANNFLPIITKLTRITDYTKTLIDHIQGVPKKTKTIEITYC
jgi:hypothetical protein